MNNPKLSIIVLNYNTKRLLQDCLNSLEKVKNEVAFEVIVSDNGSTDGSLEMLSKTFPSVKIVQNDENLGYAKGNNQARNLVKGELVLFLNTDTVVPKDTLFKTVEYLDSHKSVGALTCKIVLPSGRLDKDSRRRFPTPWISLGRLFLGLSGKYWYRDIPEDKTHEADVIQGAFFLTRKKLLDTVDWFDEDYFLDGEDIDLCWKIKEKGYKIIYYPQASILHIKKATKKILGRKYIEEGVTSMEIFYRKHLWRIYPFFINWLVIIGIGVIRTLRFAKALFSK
jgi:hypothetical protein